MLNVFKEKRINKFKNIKKLKKILDCIKNIEVTNDSIIIETNKSLFFKTSGHQVFYSDGQIAIVGERIHLNPNIKEFEQKFYEGNFKEIEEKINYEIEKNESKI